MELVLRWGLENVSLFDLRCAALHVLEHGLQS